MVTIEIDWTKVGVRAFNAGVWVRKHLFGTALLGVVFLAGIVFSLVYFRPVVRVLEHVVVQQDAATISDLEMGNSILSGARDRLAAKLKESEEKYLSVTKELAERTEDANHAFGILGTSVKLVELPRHVLALRKQDGDWAGDFNGIYVTAYYRLTESMGVSKSWFQRNALGVLKEVFFDEGSTKLWDLWRHPLGRTAILSVAASYKRELQVFNKYPQLLGAYDPEKINGLLDLRYQERKAAIESAYDISGVTDNEANNITFMIKFLDRRYRERIAGQESVDTLLLIAQEVMAELHPAPVPQQLGIKLSPAEMRF